MNSIRKWLYRPKKTDTSYLAQFYFADEELNLVAAELDSFDGRKDPERCTMLVNQLRVCQDKVLTVIQKTMDDAIPGQRANRDFRVKFPDDVLQDSLAGQLWFGAECLAAGSSILNREVESASMRPLARALTKNLDSLRCILRDQCLRTVTEYTERIREAFVIFDKLFAEFELSYVSAMVPVKTMKEYDMLQEVTVLFSETVNRALKISLLTQDMIDDYDPALMFTIPRLAIVCGLLIYPEGPLNPDMEPTNMTEMYRPFQTLLFKIRELLYTLSDKELILLERSLCSSETPEVTTPAAGNGQSEAFLQVDQGFDEGEGVVNLDTIGSNILMHSPSSGGSPVTPVNSNPELDDFGSVSPSTTVVDGNFRFASPSSLNRAEIEDAFSNLNKSESQDSGLHSENVSTFDTVTVDSLSLVSQETDGATIDKSSPSEKTEQKREKTLSVPESVTNSSDVKNVKTLTDISEHNTGVSDSCSSASDSETFQDNDLTWVNEDQCLKSCCRLEEGSGVRHLCREIVDEIVINALHSVQILKDIDADINGDTIAGAMNNSSMCDSDIKDICEGARDVSDNGRQLCDETTGNIMTETENEARSGAPEFSRQFSWQYNVQFAIPRISMSEQEADSNGDRLSSGSFSSDSTISDTNQKDSVNEFVNESLASMNKVSEPLHSSDSVQTETTNSHIEIEPSASSRLEFIGSGDQNVLQISTSTDLDLIFPQNQNSSLNTHSSNTQSRVGLDGYVTQSNSNTNSNSHHQSGSNGHSSLNAVNQRHVPRSKSRKERKSSVEGITCRTGTQGSSGLGELSLEVPRVQRLKYTESVSSSCSSCQSECDCDKDCTCAGSETSSYNSETNDEEEIALAIQAAEIASRNEARSRFRSSSDLIHRLFVCIAGVADQLQTNYASDLRHILKCVFELHSTNEPEPEPTPPDTTGDTSSEDQGSPTHQTNNQTTNRTSSNMPQQPPRSPRRIFDEPPEWVPDDETERCTACKTVFTFMRRRHHCRNCGKIFCGKCTSTTVPLPQYGHQKPVRVCHRCFLYQVAHFTISE